MGRVRGGEGGEKNGVREDRCEVGRRFGGEAIGKEGGGKARGWVVGNGEVGVVGVVLGRRMERG